MKDQTDNRRNQRVTPCLFFQLVRNSLLFGIRRLIVVFTEIRYSSVRNHLDVVYTLFCFNDVRPSRSKSAGSFFSWHLLVNVYTNWYSLLFVIPSLSCDLSQINLSQHVERNTHANNSFHYNPIFVQFVYVLSIIMYFKWISVLFNRVAK